MILILTDKFDKHADYVIEKIISRNTPYYRLNLDVESLLQTKITFKDNCWIIDINSEKIQLSDIKCIWLRRPFVEVSLEEQSKNDYNFKIWRGEWNKTLLGMYYHLGHLPWLNSLKNAYNAENKYFQINTALQIGFNLPKFVVSNDKNELQNFILTHGDCVLKLMNQEFYKVEDNEFKGIYVNKLDINDIQSFTDSSENPIMIQNFVEKLYEVRYTVVDTQHHVCRIDSQKSNIANIDWRRYDIPNTPHYVIEPPDEIRIKVDQLIKKLGLTFGALDFIVSPSGKWYFLEINSMGQWLWIESLTQTPIADSIVDWLINNTIKKG
jgi:glutathione synthase/RimK-type ligase-like ATP-grasp enzyme